MWYSLCDAITGQFTGARFELNTAGLDLYAITARIAEHVPVGCVAVPGQHDHRTRRVEAGGVVNAEPAPPDAAQELFMARARRRMPLLTAIAAIEAGQGRAVREVTEALLTGDAPPAAATARLAEIAAAIAPLRTQLAAIDAAQTMEALAAIT